MLSVALFWGVLVLVLFSCVAVGMGRQGWRSVRHEIRKRRSL